MQKLNLPSYPFRITTRNNKQYIFDSIRKKFVLLTPEEWVRQHFIQYLITEKKYSPSLLLIEKNVTIYKTTKRADIVVFNTEHIPYIIVECKSYNVPITQNAMEQIFRYNLEYKAEYLILTNGMIHYCCKTNYKTNTYNFMNEVPENFFKK